MRACAGAILAIMATTPIISVANSTQTAAGTATNDTADADPETVMSKFQKGYGVKPTGLRPIYPPGYRCSPLTSLYASWVDVDGGLRDSIHSGVDGGRLGEWITAPADGTVIAVWRANWQWGWEGSLLILHDQDDVNMDDGADYYVSEFDHLDYDDIKKFKSGDRIRRGQRLTQVSRPGGKLGFLPETHWEVWELDTDEIVWKKNEFKAPVWSSPGAELIDPLYMLAQNQADMENGDVYITPAEACRNDPGCRGFSYILPCIKHPKHE